MQELADACGVLFNTIRGHRRLKGFPAPGKKGYSTRLYCNFLQAMETERKAKIVEPRPVAQTAAKAGREFELWQQEQMTTRLMRDELLERASVEDAFEEIGNLIRSRVSDALDTLSQLCEQKEQSEIREILEEEFKDWMKSVDEGVKKIKIMKAKKIKTATKED